MRNPILAIGIGLIGISAMNVPVAYGEAVCPKPIDAVLGALQCFEDEDPQCVANHYSGGFVLLHNGQPTSVNPSDVDYWTNAFMLSDVSTDINHLTRVGLNQVSIRYIETLDFINGVSIDQHEHALVTIDKNCKIKIWDQYGDNAEQQAVADTVQDIVCQFFGLCN